MAFVENYLKQYGFDPRAEAVRLNLLSLRERQKTLKENLTSYTKEVVGDEPVSLLYYYWFDESGRLFTNSSLTPVYCLDIQLDDKERNGLPKIGTYQAANMAYTNPGCLIGWYSPKGPAEFGNIRSDFGVINYDYGQLYLLRFDGEKIESLAVKIEDEKPGGFLEGVTQAVFKKAQAAKSKEEAIATFMLNPVMIGTLENLERKEWPNIGEIIYQSSIGRQYSLAEILKEVKANFNHQKKYCSDVYPDQTIFALEARLVTEDMIMAAYMQVIYRHMEEKGMTSMSLSGSCGGSVISLEDVNNLLGINSITQNPFEQLDSHFSSAWREMTQKKGKEYGFNREGECRVCHRATKVGPCSICEGCDHAIRARNKG